MNAFLSTLTGAFLVLACAVGAAQEAAPPDEPAQTVEVASPQGDGDPPDVKDAEVDEELQPDPAADDAALAEAAAASAEAADELAGDEPAAELATDATADEAPADAAVAADDAPAPPQSDVTAATVDLSEIMDMLKSQQEELAAQRKLIERQGREVAGLRDELDALRAPPVVEKPEDTQEAVREMDNREAPVDMPVPPESDVPASAVADAAAEARIDETAQQVTEAQQDDPTRDTLEDFDGSWRLPGTEAALRIGGYVKATLINNFDPLVINDRFIVGSIPIGSVGEFAEEETIITANQSRLNFDLRQPTQLGLLRAFIEGDFSEENDTYRLRHAFGQWNRLLAGQTWSAFVDTQASPEEIDFEGLNGRINVRQSQIRLMPRLGSQFEFQLSLEDPNPSIENGEGVSQRPDVVLSGRFDWGDDLHLKVGAILRQIRGQWELNPGNTESENGWGMTVSGRLDFPLFDERDNILFQLNGGKGIGRYVTDLRSTGSFDGRFDPITGDLDLIDVLSGYVSAQHWWGETLRSNLTMGYVYVDYTGFEQAEDYDNTFRISTNMLWSPTPRIDLGGEVLWGRRELQDGSNGDALQAQFTAKYRF